MTINSDDPTMFHTDIGEEYVRLCTALGYGTDQVEAFAVAGVDAAWLDEADRASMRASFIAELSALGRELGASASDGTPLTHPEGRRGPGERRRPLDEPVRGRSRSPAGPSGCRG